jgi:hypothetical protein
MKRWLRNTIVYLVLLLFTFFPILCILFVSGVANACGCRVDEGAVHPCVVLGVDIGAALYTLGVMGWLIFFTFPLGCLTIFACTIFVIVEYVLSRQRKPPEPLP